MPYKRTTYKSSTTGIRYTRDTAVVYTGRSVKKERDRYADDARVCTRERCISGTRRREKGKKQFHVCVASRIYMYEFVLSPVAVYYSIYPTRA